MLRKFSLDSSGFSLDYKKTTPLNSHKNFISSFEKKRYFSLENCSESSSKKILNKISLKNSIEISFKNYIVNYLRVKFS